MKKEFMLSPRFILILSLLFAHSSVWAQGANFSNNILSLPVVVVGENLFSAELQLSKPDPAEFVLNNASQLVTANKQDAAIFNINVLNIPRVNVGGKDYSVKLDMINIEPLIFRLGTAEEIPALDNGSGDLNKLFDNLDAELAKKQVSTNTPTGLWLLYSKGVSDQFVDLSSQGADIISHRKTYYLHAYVMSVFLGQKSYVNFAECSKLPNSRLLVDGVFDKDHTVDQLSASLHRLWIGPGDFPYRAGDVRFAVLREKEFNVRFVNNREMIFDPFTYTDSEGSFQGSFTVIMKARKISDDITKNLGMFKFNDIVLDSHCFRHTIYSSGTASLNTQGDITTGDSVNEEIYIQSKSESIASFMLYQKRGDITIDRNGQSIFSNARTVFSFRSLPSPGLFPSVSSFTSSTDPIIREPDGGHILNFSIKNKEGVETAAGTIEAKL